MYEHRKATYVRADGVTVIYERTPEGTYSVDVTNAAKVTSHHYFHTDQKRAWAFVVRTMGHTPAAAR